MDCEECGCTMELEGREPNKHGLCHSCASAELDILTDRFVALEKERDAALLQIEEARYALGEIFAREGPGLDGSSENASGRIARVALENLTKIADGKMVVSVKGSIDLAICGWCAGAGKVEGLTETSCPKCHGAGYIKKPQCVHEGGTIPCDHQKPCPDHSCACGTAVAKRGDKCLRCGGFAEKRVAGSPIPNSGQHSMVGLCWCNMFHDR